MSRETDSDVKKRCFTVVVATRANVGQPPATVVLRQVIMLCRLEAGDL